MLSLLYKLNALRHCETYTAMYFQSWSCAKMWENSEYGVCPNVPMSRCYGMCGGFAVEICGGCVTLHFTLVIPLGLQLWMSTLRSARGPWRGKSSKSTQWQLLVHENLADPWQLTQLQSMTLRSQSQWLQQFLTRLNHRQCSNFQSNVFARVQHARIWYVDGIPECVANVTMIYLCITFPDTVLTTKQPEEGEAPDPT